MLPLVPVMIGQPGVLMTPDALLGGKYCSDWK